MSFTESLKVIIRRKCHNKCCLCEQLGVEIHHIISQKENGSDTEENAAPLCPTCHELYGDNPKKRKLIRERRDLWYELCDKKYKNEIEENFVTRAELNELKELVSNRKADSNSLLNRFLKMGTSNSTILDVRILIGESEFRKAKSILEENFKEYEENSEYYYLLGYVYGELDDERKMLNNFTKSEEINLKYSKRISQSKMYYWALNFNKGVQYFNESTSANNHDGVKEKLSKALEAFKKSLLCRPYSIDTLRNLIFVLISLENEDEATKYLETMIELHDDENAFTMLGEIYIQKYNEAKSKREKKKYIEKAIELLEKGNDHYPHNADILLYLSNAYVSSENPNKAFEVFRKGVELEPLNKYYRYNYGVILLEEEEFEKAVEQFEKAIEIDPSYSNALYNLASTNVKWGTEIRDKAVEEGIEDESYKEKFKKSLPHFERYLELNPNDAQIWKLLGRIYANLEMVEKSMEAFNNVNKKGNS